MFLAVLYCASGWGKDVRSRLWNVFDQDTLHLHDGGSISGWIWTETDEAVMGKKINGDLFTVPHTELENINRNALLGQLKKIL